MALGQRSQEVLLALVLATCVLVGETFTVSKPRATEAEAVAYLNTLDPQYSEECKKQMTARWDYVTNVTPENEEAATTALNNYLEFQATVQAKILQDFGDYNDDAAEYSEQTRRELTFLASRGPGTMDSANVEEMNQIMATMETKYATAKLCKYVEKDSPRCQKVLALEPDLEDLLRTAKDYEELEYYWTGWHDALKTGTAETPGVGKDEYARFIELQNELATGIGYSNMGDLWAAPYDDGSATWTAAKFEQDMLDIWETLLPNYKKLHAYVRMKLRQNPEYAAHINKTGPIPAHLLGNMWAQDWTGLESSTKPHPEEVSLDATEAMIKQGYDARKMFDVANDFFKGLGLQEMTETFWQESMLTKPTDREVVCHASAEDFCGGPGSEDFRIKMCTNVNQDDLVTVHHEMGHIEYFMQYSHHHLIFREGANPGFHEAIGDALALAVTTPKHLQCKLGLELGLPDTFCTETAEVQVQKKTAAAPREVTNIDRNFLYYMALQKFTFFPFAISMDSWRWGVFDGSITKDQFNSKWWEIRLKNQGIIPPTDRTSGEDATGGIDAAAKYHIVGNVEYIRYFVSHILQFQFYEAMCKAAGQYDPNDPNGKPLYQCDFAESAQAGKLFEEMMQLGFSKPWPEALQAITGSPSMNTDALNNYFAPLFEYIDAELKANGEYPGWSGEANDEEAKALEYVQNRYEKEMSSYCNVASIAEFEYNTDLLNAEKEAAAGAAAAKWAAFEASEYETTISKFDYESFQNEELKRTYKFLNAIGTSKLPTEKFEQYSKVLSEMSKIYGTGKVCPYEAGSVAPSCDLEKEGLALEPELTAILANPQPENQEELAYYWKAWRDATGAKMRGLFLNYVDLSNEAAVLNGEANMGDYWLMGYESETFRADIERVWNEVKLYLYRPLYGYVRYMLKEKGFNVTLEGPIGAHLFGNMWAQSWENLLPHVVPFPTEPTFDITEKLKELTASEPTALGKAKKLFGMANDFFVETGLEDMKEAYGDTAMIVKPDDREVVCHASAWDMCDKKDFRIKMCTEVDQSTFITIHHELGHIQYYKQYKEQLYPHRGGANDGFHEAIGDVLGLSVSSPAHLETLGLIESGQLNENATVNYLLQQALEKIAFLPFGYLIDSYRWKIFSGEITPDNMMLEWIKIRGELQGIEPPFKRTENDFDPGAKYHVPGNTPYMRYFISFILQFQVQAHLCKLAGHTGPLYNCDIYQNKPAGEEFAKIMKAGASKPWNQLLQEVIGTDKLDAGAIRLYFEPLTRFLRDHRATHGDYTLANSFNAEFYMEDFQATSTQPSSSTGVPTGPGGSSSQNPTDSTMGSSAATDGPGASSTTPPDNDGGKKKDTAAIIVGIVLACSVVVVIVGYFFGAKFCKKK